MPNSLGSCLLDCFASFFVTCLTLPSGVQLQASLRGRSESELVGEGRHRSRARAKPRTHAGERGRAGRRLPAFPQPSPVLCPIMFGVYKALYDYTPQDPETELPLVEGQVLYILVKEDEE